jgi:hypothetical protein
MPDRAHTLSPTERRPTVRQSRRASCRPLERCSSHHHATRAFPQRSPASSGEGARIGPIRSSVPRFALMRCETMLPIARR